MGFPGVEISGGRYDNNQLAKLKKISNKTSLCLHNYFPPPKKPFVLNLASLNKTISSQSLRQARKSISWSSTLGAKHYSLHAGLLFDPEPSSLGGAMKKTSLAEKTNAMNVFLENINKLSEFANGLGIQLLIENNVLTKKNYKIFGTDPFLMCWTVDSLFVMKNTPTNVSLLVDVGHVKVTARTLGLNPCNFLQECAEWIGGYHLSENNSFEDQNKPATPNSWFWPFLIKNLPYYSIEVNSCSIDLLRNQEKLARTKLK